VFGKDNRAGAIEEGKLFELIFTEEGRKLWEKWGEDRIRELVMKKLGIAFEKRKNRKGGEL
jgi:hypothetical protein